MRWALASMAGALMLAVAACDGEATPPASSSAEPPPAVTSTAAPTATPARTPTPSPTPAPTSTPSPTPSPTPVPTLTPGATPAPTPTPSPTPVSTSTPSPTPEPTPTPTPEPHGIEFTPITRGEPRPLPAGIALYYWVYPCTGCGAQPADYRRVVFEEAVGALREDRPLAFFDGASDREHYNPVRSFGVSGTGQTLAAAVCHAGYCEVEVVDGEYYPSSDSELRLWVTRNDGRTWEDWGQTLPQTRIIAVTDDDVVVSTENIWADRWDWLTDEQWAQMLERLATLGLDEREGWRYRRRWVRSGEAYSPPPEPVPPSVGAVNWKRADIRLDGVVAWAAGTQGGYLIALANADGSVRRAYASTDDLEGRLFIVENVLVRPTGVLRRGNFQREVATLEIIDLTSATLHEVEGLALPLGFDPEEGVNAARGLLPPHGVRPAPAGPSVE